MSAATLRTQRQEVEPRKVPEALGALWRECCATEPRSDVSRALIANFLAIGDASRERELHQMLGDIVARVPCRAFLITLRDGQGAIAAAVSGAARLHGSTRDLVLEQIELTAPTSAFDQLAGLVRPLLVNDLPTHLYWATDWPSDPRPFDLFTVMAEHTIVDSARFLLPPVALDAVQRRRDRGRAISDLGWLRLRPWRRALAEAFERFAWRRGEPTEVTVRCGGNGVAAGSLLGRWLEQKLAARVSLESTASPHGGLEQVQLQHGGALALLTLNAHGQVEVRLTTDDSCYLPFLVPASRGSEAGLLAAAIDLA